ncbi:hypothetical protein [Parendozoicomonas sp. Alg238-R29]|uniref:hypothetical protein n=1 Tax=Parendozoicomonas sp. Alg238-R29 TaxID=2993446 RepID=UPI00248DDEDA|nr:hypothetical protein [Parendozoicomonas sp. Alg238-R29]
MYEAQLQFMHDSHNRKPKHPKVVIEGGGPVGLISAMRQYQKGAEVVILEQRNTLYNRPQIVRLDNQWDKDLRHYLGDQFDELLAPGSGKTKLQPDGSIHVVTKALEDALHKRLSELVSSDPNNPPRIQRLAAHELTMVEPPDHAGGRYKVRAQYKKKYDLGSEKNPKQPEQEVFEADLLICAGGKESPTRNKFLNHCPVTHPKQYGVASWEGPSIKNEDLSTFPAFQDVLATDVEFQQSYKSQLHEALHPFTGNLGAILSPAGRKEMTRALGLTEQELIPLRSRVPQEDKAFLEEVIADLRENRINRDIPVLGDMLTAINKEVCQLRTFENRNLFYLGMEIPGPAHQWMETVGQNLEEQEKGEVQRLLKQLWFQAAGEKQGFAKTHGANLGLMNKQFATTFPVAQDKPADHFTVISGKNGGPSLTVAASGDAATSPHFMTYSGLTGGRETIDALCGYTDRVASDKTTRGEIEQKLLEDYDRTAEFILYKGSNFLKPRDSDDIRASLKANARTEVENLGGTTQTGYTVTKTHGDSYLLDNGDETFSMVIDENGRFQVEGYNNGRPDPENLGTFSTFRHFELQCLS